MMERRSHPRVKISRPALYFTDIYARPTVATTVDLSVGGTRIHTPYSLVSGESLQISIAIRPQVIRCVGKVVHILEIPDGRVHAGARHEAGIRFEDMSMQDRLYLGEYLSSLMEEPS